MERKLASIRKVKEIRPIEGADAIELAIVDGWQCVVKKSEFSEGDWGVYFEIDSFLPICDTFEFLRKSSFKKMGDKEGLRLKSIKLRKQLSQGLILPMNSLEAFMSHDEWITLELGADVTEQIGVEKYDPPIPAQLAGQVRGNFPSFIHKTDQERVQNLFDKYSETMTDIEFEVTLKLDGTSCTYYIVNTNEYNTRKADETEVIYFGHCSRNLDTKEGDSTPWKIARESGLKDRMIKFNNDTGRSIAIQGELMGPSIQNNREGLHEPKFFLFDIWDIDEQRYLTADERELIVDILEVEHVPVLDPSMKVFEKFKTINEILDFAEGPSIKHNVREGVVFKSNTLVDGEQVSFKSISNKFLLKGGD